MATRPASSLSSLARESAVYGLATIAGGLLTVLLTPLYARYLPEEDLAFLTVANSLVVLLAAVASLALENAAHRWYWDTEDDRFRREVFTTWFATFAVVSVALAILLAAASRPIASVLDSPAHADALLLAAATLPLRVVFLVSTNWHRARREPSRVLVLSLVNTVVLVPLTVVALRASGDRVFLAFGAQVIAFGVSAIAAAPAVRRWFVRSGFSRPLLRQMLHFSAPLIPAAIASWALALADRWLLALLSSPGEVATYQVAVTYALTIGLPVAAFQQAWGPFGQSIHREGDAHAIYRRTVRIVTIALALASVAVSLIAPEVIVAVFGRRYEDATASAVILVFGQIMLAGYAAAGLGLNLVRRTHPIAIALLLGGIVNVALCLLVIPRFGSEGAAFATLAATLVMTAYLFRQSERAYPIGYRLVPVAAIVAVAGACCAVGLHLPVWTRYALFMMALAAGTAVAWRLGASTVRSLLAGIATSAPSPGLAVADPGEPPVAPAAGPLRRVASALNHRAASPWRRRIDVVGLALFVVLVPWEVTKLIFPVLQTEYVGPDRVSVIDLSRLALALLCLLLPGAAARLIERRRWVELLLPVGLVAVFSIATLYSPDRSGAVTELIRLFSGIAIFVLFAATPRDITSVRYVIAAFRASMLAVGAVIGAQVATGFHLWNGAVGSRYSGPFGDPNIAARFLLVAAILAVFAPLDDRVRLPLERRAAELAVYGCAILVTGSRSALLVAAAVGVAGIAVVEPRTRRIAAVAVAVAAIAVVALAMLLPVLGDRLETFASTDTLLGSRRALIEAGVAMFGDHPLLGVGLAGYGPELLGDYASYQSYYGSTQFRSHTSAVTTVAELGMMGVAALVSVAAVAVRSFAAARAAVAWRAGGREASALLLSVTAVFLASQSEGRFWEEPLLWALLGLAVALRRIVEPQAPSDATAKPQRVRSTV